MQTTNTVTDKIAAEHDLTKSHGKALVESMPKVIAEAAAEGEEVFLPRFDKFKVKSTPERDGRNPLTGATLKIAAAQKLSFIPAKAMKDLLNK